MATRQRICRIRILAENSPFLSNLSTRQNGLFRKCVGLARLADIRQAVSRGLSRLADIRRAVLRGLAKLADIRQAVLRGLARLANTRQRPFLRKIDTFARVIRHSRKFGASGHCLCFPQKK